MKRHPGTSTGGQAGVATTRIGSSGTGNLYRQPARCPTIRNNMVATATRIRSSSSPRWSINKQDSTVLTAILPDSPLPMRSRVRRHGPCQTLRAMQRQPCRITSTR